MNSSNYKEMMAELQEEYLNSFDEKFSVMRSCLEGLNWYSLELEFHKLKGTGSTYGIPEVTELCQHMESLCRKKGSLSETQLEAAIALLQEIRKKYTDQSDYDLCSDPRYLELKKN